MIGIAYIVVPRTDGQFDMHIVEPFSLALYKQDDSLLESVPEQVATWPPADIVARDEKAMRLVLEHSDTHILLEKPICALKHAPFVP